MEHSVFVDWLSMYQVHHRDGALELPVVNDGNVWAVDHDGKVEWTTQRHLITEGSFDSRLRLRCDGIKVEVSGNIGRWNRRDNLFGYSFEECVRRWNALLNLFSLPPFTHGEPMWVYGSRRLEFSGAVVTRIDVTKNYACWSPENLRLYMGWLGTHQQGRRKVGVSADGHTIVWGEGSKYLYEKCYSKAVELVAHRKRGHVADEVVEFAQQLGVLRHELELKTRFLTQKGLRFLAEVTMGKLMQLYRERSQLILEDKIPFDDFNDIPRPYRGTAKDWRDGADLKGVMSRTGFFRHRAWLKKHHNIDIAVRCNVAHLPLKVREIEVTALIAPDWYRERYA